MGTRTHICFWRHVCKDRDHKKPLRRVFTSKSRSGLLAKFVVLNRLELARDILTQDISVPQVFVHEISKDLAGVLLKTRNDHLFDRFRGEDSILKVQKRKSEISI